MGKENLCGVRRGDSYPQALPETFLYLRSGEICEGSLIKGKAWSLALANSRSGCHCHWTVAWVSALEPLTQGHLVPPPAPTLSGPAASLAVFHIHQGDGTSRYRESRSNLVPLPQHLLQSLPARVGAADADFGDSTRTPAHTYPKVSLKVWGWGVEYNSLDMFSPAMAPRLMLSLFLLPFYLNMSPPLGCLPSPL